jgi:Zn-dependent protease
MRYLLEVDLQNPLLWALLVGWILSVVLHEFAHGIVAYWGGDYTIRERGGLSLNPLYYVDPMMSIVFPAIMLAMGAIPLPGGATYIRRDLLKNRFWESAVSLAGPAMNGLLLLACIIPLHPAFGWASQAGIEHWTSFQVFLGGMAVLQMLALILNLVPVPPLDGFRVLSPFLPEQVNIKLGTPPVSTTVFFIYFLVLWNTGVLGVILVWLVHFLQAIGFGGKGAALVVQAYVVAMFGQH